MTGLRAGSATDVGLVRVNNQDNMLLADPLYAVADGMGGHAAGEVASETAVQALESAWKGSTPPTPEALAEAARAANRAVWEKAQADAELRGMGTTLVAVALIDEQLAVINVGDSRAYRLRHGELSQLTSDHSLVAELVAEGQIHSDEAEFHPQRHVLTRALGVDVNVGVDLLTLDVETGDRVLLCSDGLCREISDDQIAAILRRLADPTEAAKEMVNEAKARGGNDNITVIVIDAVVADAVGDAAVAAPTVGAEAAGAEAAGVENDGRDATTVVAAGPGPVADDPTVVAPTGEPATPAPSGTPAAGAAELSRRQRRRQRRAAEGPKARVVTVRVVAFIVLLLLVLAAGAAAVVFYARGSYYVGVSQNQLLIYQGRPGGVLWFQPTVSERTGVTTARVLPGAIPALRAGVDESSLGAARAYVSNLQREYQAAQGTPGPNAGAAG